MLKGETVSVYYPTAGAPDSFGGQEGGFSEAVEVENVLFAPVSTADMEASRPDGLTVDVKFYFPKSYSGESLRGAKIGLGDETYSVIGNPQVYPALCPTSWNMVAEGVRDDG